MKGSRGVTAILKVTPKGAAVLFRALRPRQTGATDIRPKPITEGQSEGITGKVNYLDLL